MARVRKQQLRKLVLSVADKIRREYQPEKIILFGSYAYGEPTEDSDIDLFIVKETDKRRVDRFVEISRILYEHDRRVSISPLVYTPKEVEERLALGDDFVLEVLTKGKVLYAR